MKSKELLLSDFEYDLFEEQEMKYSAVYRDIKLQAESILKTEPFVPLSIFAGYERIYLVEHPWVKTRLNII